MNGGNAVVQQVDEEKDAKFVLEVESIDLEGRGVGRHEGRVVFLDNGLPGERVVAQTVKRRGRYDKAQTLEILSASSARVVPRCPSYGSCGGCSMQHMDAATQLAVKQRVLEDQLWYLARIRPDQVLAPIMGAAWNTRRRARLSVRYVVRKGKVLVGFHERSSRFVADMLECHVLSQRVSALLPVLRELVAALSIRDRIPQIEVAEGDALAVRGDAVAFGSDSLAVGSDAVAVGSDAPQTRKTETVLALVFRVLEAPSAEDLRRLCAFAAAQALEVWLQPKGPDSVRLLHPEHSSLAYALKDFGLRMEFRPTDFTQVNHPMNAAMIARALRLLELAPADAVLDLFSGLGNFSLPLARTARRVLGIELSAELSKRAQTLAQRHGLDGVACFRTANLFEITASEWEHFGGFNKVLVDPPREGAQRVCEHLARQATPPSRIVYVSCNPATLARDAAILVHQGPFRLRCAGVMNMFPQTSHVESMAVFEIDPTTQSTRKSPELLALAAENPKDG